MWHPISPANALQRLSRRGSRTISTKVLSSWVPLAPLTAPQLAHWEAQLGPLMMSAGDVSNMGAASEAFCPSGHIASLRACMDTWGIPPGDDAPVTLACQGSGFHHDADSYAGHGFCVLWLSPDVGWDLYFPITGDRIPLTYGSVVLFDSALLHGVVMRGETVYSEASFSDSSAGLCLSQDFPLQRIARRRLSIDKFSRHGTGNKTLLGADGIQESVDLETGRWTARNISRR
jgi:hypothetical protein